MARALRPSPGLGETEQVPPIRARWNGYRVNPKELGRFLRLTGLEADDGVPLLYPHVVGFPLQMVILTNHAFPLSIWGSLQIRNQILQHAVIRPDATIDLETVVTSQRILGKGVEVDLYTRVHTSSGLAWESLNTFYYRGRIGNEAGAPAPTQPPGVPEEEAARWRTPTGDGWRFGRLTGDYNGIHIWSWYARRLGFQRSFHHPQLLVGQCMARLDLPAADRQRLDVWIKGPVYRNSDVTVHAATDAASTTFALLPDHDHRPAIIGRWTTTSVGRSLLDSPPE